MTVAHLALVLSLVAFVGLLWLVVDSVRHKRTVREELDAVGDAIGEAEKKAISAALAKFDTWKKAQGGKR